MIRITRKIKPFQNTNSKKVLFTGGGTGGHLFPALAVAKLLEERNSDLEISFAGNGTTGQCEPVRQAGFEYHKIACHRWPNNVVNAIKFIGKNYQGYRNAVRMLKQENISVVVGSGGFASAPVARAAVSCAVPLILLEHNMVAGKVNRWLACKAAAVCVAFEQTAKSLPPNAMILVTGTPIRSEFLKTANTIRETGHQTTPSKKQLLVLGGSAGAEIFNQQVPQALKLIATQSGENLFNDWQMIHQAGAKLEQRQLEEIRQAYRKLGIKAEVVSFIDAMPQAIASSQIVITRAGGASLAEIAASGAAAIIIPYPHAADDHQRRNADYFRQADACKLIDQRWEDVPQRLSMHLRSLLSDQSERNRLSNSIHRLAKCHATTEVAQCVEQCLS